MSTQSPIKVAIVGGGCAALAAAFELTRAEQDGRYQVTVYQTGWRLGGKGASGRGPADRIEEHGLHVWMGFYENAFGLLRACYAELGRDRATCPIADWQDAFFPAPLIAVTERGDDTRWTPWIAELPPAPGLPGDPDAAGRVWSMTDYVRRVASLLATVFSSLRSGAAAASAQAPGTADPDDLARQVARLLRVGELATLAALAEAAGLLEALLGAVGRIADSSLVVRLIEALAVNARQQIEALAAQDQELRRLWTILDLTLATLKGIVRHGLLTDVRGLDAIDQYECREWLLLNGASRTAVDSAYIRGLYDLAFSFEDGDPEKPAMAAGQALRGLLRMMFTYRGAFFWKMRAGMGDVVFAPLYEVLRRRGVEFRFFHRLENVHLADAATLAPGETPYVESLDFDVQALVKRGRYEPLVDVRGLPCWPAAPDWEQLVDGDRLAAEGWALESHWDRRRAGTQTLRVGEDFDMVVLGVGIGAIPYVCREIVARDPRWRAMVDHVKTVATQAFQLWLSTDTPSLGWPHPPVTLSGFDPIETWADMTHLLPFESWTPPAPPQSIAYFCSSLCDLPDGSEHDADYGARQRERVRQTAVEFLRERMPILWPRSVDPQGQFRWDLLVDADGSTLAGAERFATQYWTANVNPSDRFTLSLPGSTVFRISPLDATYDNLTICGDWTDCGFNAGCVEAAVMSGRLASHALSQQPRLEDIVGYDHP